jgi:hypothetical protein
MTFTKSIPTLCIAGAAFFALAASSPQCARTEDAVTSPTVGALGEGNPCMDSCINSFQEGMRAEHDRFKTAIGECDDDPVCEEEQEAIHESMIAELQADKASCFVNCGHEQGGGTSGQ